VLNTAFQKLQYCTVVYVECLYRTPANLIQGQSHDNQTIFKVALNVYVVVIPITATFWCIYSPPTERTHTHIYLYTEWPKSQISIKRKMKNDFILMMEYFLVCVNDSSCSHLSFNVRHHDLQRDMWGDCRLISRRHIICTKLTWTRVI